MKSKEQNPGTDRRTRYTRSVIRQSLLTLMQQKPFAKITVTEICRLSEINRGTFYLHYYDLEDVLDDVIKEMIRDFTQVFDHVMCPEKSRCTYPFCRKVQESREFCILFSDETASPDCWNVSASFPKKILSPGSCRTVSSPTNRRRLSSTFR